MRIPRHRQDDKNQNNPLKHYLFFSLRSLGMKWQFFLLLKMLGVFDIMDVFFKQKLYPKNHGISKLVVWRSQNPAIESQTRSWEGPSWFLGYGQMFYHRPSSMCFDFLKNWVFTLQRIHISHVENSEIIFGALGGDITWFSAQENCKTFSSFHPTNLEDYMDYLQFPLSSWGFAIILL